MNAWIVDAGSPNTAEGMICTLAGMCNHASTWDGAGFSKMDSSFGHSLAQQASQGRAWSTKQAAAALKMLRRYQRQLGGKDFMDRWLEKPTFRQLPWDQDKRSEQASVVADRTLTSRDSIAVFSFRYDPDVVQAIKTDLKGEHRGQKFWPVWDPSAKCWTVPVNETSIWSIMDIAERFRFKVEQRFTDYLERVREKTAESRTMLALNDGRNIVVTEDSIMISIADASILEEFERELIGA
jgi:hypothetical protein